MRGTALLVALRQRGIHPALVTVDVDRTFPAWYWRDWPVERDSGPLNARIGVEPGESLARLDLRCVIGLTVQVSGDDLERVQAVGRACEAAQAERVITTVRQGTHPDAIVITDTEGSLTWPK